MPTLTVTEVVGYAHCRNPRCPGSQQEQVKALRHVDSYTYVERGGDLPGEEMSTEHFSFFNDGSIDPETKEQRPDETPCPNCKLLREITGSPRPSYQGEWGNQDFLLDIDVKHDGSRFDPELQSKLQSEASDKLLAENGELRERLARLEAILLGQQSVQKVEE